MAAEDVSTAVSRAAVGSPTGGIHEVSGPEEFHLNEFVAKGLAARQDPRTVVVDPGATYFGAILSERELVPAPDAEAYSTTFAEWLTAAK